MQTEQFDSAAERRTLIACVVSTEFLSKVVSRLGKEPFAAKEANRIYSWCVKFYKKYHTAPEKEIEGMFEEWAKTNKDKHLHSMIERILSSLSGQYEKIKGKFNLEFNTDIAEKFFNEVIQTRLIEEVRADQERGTVEMVTTKLRAYKPVDLRSPPYIDLLLDKEAQRQSLEDHQKVLIKLPGAAGDFFGEELAEDSFVAFMASAKAGKSWQLMNIAWHGIRCGQKVAYFQVGDMSRNQLMRRFDKRALYRPLKAKTVMYPIGIAVEEGHRPLANVEYEDCVFTKDATAKQVQKAYERIKAKYKGDLRISYHPVKTVSVADIKATLDRWDEEGWVSKVVVIDYAGNLAPMDHRMGPVDQVTHTWAMMRQISEIRKCLVLTANQANKEGFSAWVLTRKNFADSKMILAHVTAFLGANATDEEKTKHIVRLNFVVRREEEFSESKCLYCASALDMSNPMVVSCLPGK